MSSHLLGDLVRQPMWLGGITLAVLSYGFQALALANGPLSVVQPLIVMEVVFALPISARLNRMRLGARDWLGVALVTGGLAGGLYAASPSDGDPHASTAAWLIVMLVVAVLATAALLIGRRGSGPLRASLYAVAGAAVMGTQSGLFATTINRLQQGVVPLFTAWQTYVLVVASIGGLLLIQSAYNSGPLAASMPVIDAIEPTMAVAIGVFLFGEELAGGLARHLLAALGAAVALTGIIVLDTSPITRRMHEKEGASQRQSSGAEKDPGQGERSAAEEETSV